MIKKRTRPTAQRREIEKDNTPESDNASEEENGQHKLTWVLQSPHVQTLLTEFVGLDLKNCCLYENYRQGNRVLILLNSTKEMLRSVNGRTNLRNLLVACERSLARIAPRRVMSK